MLVSTFVTKFQGGQWIGLMVLVMVAWNVAAAGKSKGKGASNRPKQNPSVPDVTVVSGTQVPQGEIPSFAELDRLGSVGTAPVCGGTLINRNHVLTAAHCFYDGYQRFRDDEILDTLVAVNIYTLDPPSKGSEHRRVKRFWIHQDYSPDLHPNDIAILQLNRPITNIAPMRLNNVAPSRLNLNDKTAIVYGFGGTKPYENSPTSNVLLKGQVTIISNAKCAERYRNPRLNDLKYLCVEGVNDACQYDSGGPLIVMKSNVPQLSFPSLQVGIVSWGEDCGNPKYPGVYVRVSHYYKWIENITDIL